MARSIAQRFFAMIRGQREPRPLPESVAEPVSVPAVTQEPPPPAVNFKTPTSAILLPSEGSSIWSLKLEIAQNSLETLWWSGKRRLASNGLGPERRGGEGEVR